MYIYTCPGWHTDNFVTSEVATNGVYLWLFSAAMLRHGAVDQSAVPTRTMIRPWSGTTDGTSGICGTSGKCKSPLSSFKRFKPSDRKVNCYWQVIITGGCCPKLACIKFLVLGCQLHAIPSHSHKVSGVFLIRMGLIKSLKQLFCKWSLKWWNCSIVEKILQYSFQNCPVISDNVKQGWFYDYCI